MRHVRHLMGTVVSLDVRGPVSPAVVDRAFAEIERADAGFSRFRLDSELSRLNRGELAPAQASPELREVLALADAFERASGGVFTARRGGAVDTDGVVKGWAAQRAAEALADGGATDFCLNAGGDAVTRGAPAAGELWQAGVRDPHDAARLLGVVLLGEGAIASSGAYERGEHIVDGRTGAAPHDWAGVTVLDPDLTVADILATTVFAMGADGPQWAHEEFGASVIAVDAAGELTVAGPVRWARA